MKATGTFSMNIVSEAEYFSQQGMTPTLRFIGKMPNKHTGNSITVYVKLLGKVATDLSNELKPGMGIELEWAELEGASLKHNGEDVEAYPILSSYRCKVLPSVVEDATNTLILLGNMGRGFEYTPGNKERAKASVATSWLKQGGDPNKPEDFETVWFSITVWGSSANWMTEGLRKFDNTDEGKGSRILCLGRLDAPYAYIGRNDGKPGFNLQATVNQVHVMNKRGAGNGGSNGEAGSFDNFETDSWGGNSNGNSKPDNDRPFGEEQAETAPQTDAAPQTTDDEWIMNHF